MAILTRSSGSAALSGRLGKPFPIQVRGRVCFIFVFPAGRLESHCQKGGAGTLTVIVPLLLLPSMVIKCSLMVTEFPLKMRAE